MSSNHNKSETAKQPSEKQRNAVFEHPKNQPILMIIYTAIILTTIILAIQTGTAAAITEDFLATAPQATIDICACDLATNRITMINTGQVTSTYQITHEGSAATFATSAPDIFSMERNERKTITQFINAPCEARGNYNLTTKFKTIFDLEKQMTQTIRVSNCANVRITPITSTTYETCPCSPSQYLFEITNSGQHAETYKIYATTPEDINPKQITFSEEYILLEPGEHRLVTAFTDLDCGIYGQVTFTLNVLAEGTNMLAQTNFGADIKKCYDYDLKAKEKYIACQGTNTTIPIAVRSMSTIANEYNAGVVGPEWITIPDRQLTLPGGAEGDIYLKARATPETNETVSIIIDTTTTRGDVYRWLNITIEPQNCYQHEYILEKSALTQAECSPKEHGILLQNTGTQPARIHLDLVAPEWMTLKGLPNDGTGHTLLAPQQYTEFFVVSNPPCNYTGYQYFDIVATYADTGKTPITNTWKINILPADQAHKTTIDIEEISLDYSEKTIPITLANEGFEKTTYSLELAASSWMGIEPTLMTLSPGETATVYLHSTPQAETPQDTYLANIIAHVPEKQQDYNNQFSVHLYKNKQYETAYKTWNKYGQYMIITLIIIALITAPIVFKKIKGKNEEKGQQTLFSEDFNTREKEEWKKVFKQENKEKTKIMPIIIAIAVIALIGAAAYYSYNYYTTNKTTNETVTTTDTANTADITAITETAQTTAETQQNTTGISERITRAETYLEENKAVTALIIVIIILLVISTVSLIKLREKQTKLTDDFIKTINKEEKDDKKTKKQEAEDKKTKKTTQKEEEQAEKEKNTEFWKIAITAFLIIILIISIGFTLYTVFSKNIDNSKATEETQQTEKTDNQTQTTQINTINLQRDQTQPNIQIKQDPENKNIKENIITVTKEEQVKLDIILNNPLQTGVRFIINIQDTGSQTMISQVTDVEATTSKQISFNITPNYDILSKEYAVNINALMISNDINNQQKIELTLKKQTITTSKMMIIAAILILTIIITSIIAYTTLRKKDEKETEEKNKTNKEHKKTENNKKTQKMNNNTTKEKNDKTKITLKRNKK
jgi:predicted histidine transporter YuiF (NhaC family)